MNGENAVKHVKLEIGIDLVQIQNQHMEDLIVQETKVRIVTHRHVQVRSLLKPIIKVISFTFPILTKLI